MTCPRCGKQMQVGGTCPNCGYVDKSGKGGSKKPAPSKKTPAKKKGGKVPPQFSKSY